MNDAKKNLVLGMADMAIFTNTVLPNEWISKSTDAKLAVIDANWSSTTIAQILKLVRPTGARIVYEPVSAQKSGRLFAADLEQFPNHWVDLATPNQLELSKMWEAAQNQKLFESDEWWKVIDSFGIPSSGARDRFVAITNGKITDEGVPLQIVQLLPFIPTILTTFGAEGVLLSEVLKPGDSRLKDPNHAPFILSRNANGSTEVGGVYMRMFPAVKVPGDILSVNGVGDTFLGVVVAGLAKGFALDEALINLAQKAATTTLVSKKSVNPLIKNLLPEFNALEIKPNEA
jgi:pseudouridine-5'-phosphate glycosidase/pseudouridine kinase